MMRFTLSEVLAVNGHVIETTPPEICKNLEDLISRVNCLGFQPPMYCSSGYRDPEYNKKIGGATKSAHCQGKAIDIKDPKGLLKQYLLRNTQLLKEYGLRMEEPESTGGLHGGWCHLDTMPVKFRRIFRP